jgi:hypothetical protein
LLQPLQELQIGGTRVVDLKVAPLLQRVPLRELQIQNHTDFAPIREFAPERAAS